MKAKHAEVNKKKVYEKPTIRVVNITGGTQVLGIGCKLASGGSARGATPCYPGNNCFQLGS